MDNFLILLDNGHGSNTPGKCSPDGKLREWSAVRDITNGICRELIRKGFEVVLIVKEEVDIPLKERVLRVNDFCKKRGTKNVMLVSVHLNAAGGDGKWHSARGFSAHVSNNASSRSKKLAKFLWDSAIAKNLKGNRAVPKEGYITQNLAMCRDTNCAAVLTENLFMDNKEDCSFILSEAGKKVIIDAHVEGIINMINYLSHDKV